MKNDQNARCYMEFNIFDDENDTFFLSNVLRVFLKSLQLSKKAISLILI